VTTTVAARLTVITTCHGSTAMGSMVRAANGGYVNPYLVYGAR